jgi:hypothetical protein
LNFGYFYADSPVIAYDGEAHPPYSMGRFTSSSVPGCRARSPAPAETRPNDASAAWSGFNASRRNF